jgi:hypothetical protein
MESKLLDMIALHENHTGAYLFRVLQETVTDFDIENSIFRSVFLFFLNFFSDKKLTVFLVSLTIIGVITEY